MTVPAAAVSAPAAMPVRLFGSVVPPRAGRGRRRLGRRRGGALRLDPGGMCLLGGLTPLADMTGEVRALESGKNECADHANRDCADRNSAYHDAGRGGYPAEGPVHRGEDAVHGGVKRTSQ